MYGQQSGYGRVKEARGPPGANLFVYNIPETFGDGDLASLFSHFGVILSTKVFVDKMTGNAMQIGSLCVHNFTFMVLNVPIHVSL